MLAVAAVLVVGLGAGYVALAVAKPVVGKVKPSLFYSGDQEALRNLSAGPAKCFWRGDHVFMRIGFHNRQIGHITIHLQPNYNIRRGGLNGDGLGSQKDIGVDGNKTRIWVGDLGKPKGVPAGAPISRCAPEITSIENG